MREYSEVNSSSLVRLRLSALVCCCGFASSVGLTGGVKTGGSAGTRAVRVCSGKAEMVRDRGRWRTSLRVLRDLALSFLVPWHVTEHRTLVCQ